MDIKSCIEQIQSYHDLNQFQNVYPDQNIEEGLCNPDNESLFLTASIAFLHKQLLKRAEDNKIQSKKNDLISDLLILDSSNGREKIYINLKNANKFEETMRNEAALPRNKLSIAQIIPKAKKPKSKSTIFNVFVKKSSTKPITQSLPESNKSLVVTDTRPKKTLSFFTIFGSKKDLKSFNENLTENSLPSSKIEIIERYLKSIPSGTTMISTTKSPGSQSISTVSISNFSKPANDKISFVPHIPCHIEYKTNDATTERSFNSTLCSLKSSQGKLIFDKDIMRYPKINTYNYVQNIPEKPFKLCDNDKFHRTINRGAINNNEILKVTNFKSQTEISIAESSSSSFRSRVRKQQSKLSICHENEVNDSDEEEDLSWNGSEITSAKFSYNFTDELKSSLSPKLLDIVVNKVIKDLKNDVLTFE